MLDNAGWQGMGCGSQGRRMLVGRSPGYLSVAQFDLPGWVSRGCPAGVYEGRSYRVPARALHNRGLIRVKGSGRTWTAVITAEGTRLLAG